MQTAGVRGAVAPGPAGWLSRQRLALMLPVPALIAAGLGYFTFVFYPVTATASAANRALRNAAFFSEQMRQPVDRRDQRFRTKGQVIAFLRVYVLAPLQQAAREDPDDDHVRILRHVNR